MKYCVVSDIHANYPAIQAVYETVSDEVDGFIVLGDVIGLGGYPSEVVEFTIDNADHFVKGNHDVAVVEHQEGHVNSPALSEFELNITNDSLSDEQKHWIAEQESYQEIPEENLLIAHAKPYPEEASGLKGSGVDKGKFTKTASNIDSDTFDFVLLGHTHEQGMLDCSDFGHDVTILNPGSVGQPISKGKANYAVIDTETGDAELHTVEYNSEDVIEKIRSLGTPVEWWNRNSRRRNRRRQ